MTAPAPLDLDALAALDAARTPGRWHWWTSNSLVRLSSSATSKDGDVAHAYVAHDGVPDISISQANMKAIESAVNALAPLLARVRAAEARVAELEAEVREIDALRGVLAAHRARIDDLEEQAYEGSK